MERHLADASSARPAAAAITVPALQIDTASWLASLLAAFAAGSIEPASAPALCTQLQRVDFNSIVTAIELAPPSHRGRAERCLYQQWIAANEGTSPLLFAAWFNLGVLLAREGDRANALIAYSNVRAIKPDFSPAAVNLGLTFEAMGQVDTALQVWDAATQTDEARTSLLNHRARVLENFGRLDESEAALRSSLRTNPAQPDAIQHWVHIRQKMCLWPALADDMPGLPPSELLHHSGPLGVMALTDAIGLQRQVTADWIARKMPPAPLRLSPPEGYRHERIRIGYLSSDFCRHAMSFLIAELFERHDRSRFEIFGYCSTRDDGSPIRARVLAAFDHLRIVRDLSDKDAAQTIRDDEIDILIDLNGLTAHTRLAVLRWRPAPVQATYLGFVGPVPLPELDHLLCDDFVIPPGQAGQYAPAPLRIAQSYQANDSKRAIGAMLSRADVGLPEDRFVFCCFSNHYKITEPVFAAWLEILQKADAAVLWLSTDNAWSQANLHAAAAHAGIGPDRIIFAERTTPELYMSRLRLADLFLDTFPYNAGTIASDAIRMQLPLLTLTGAAFASRMAGSLLDAIGAQQGIATCLPDYIATAVSLATDGGAYSDYRKMFIGDSWARTAGNIARFTSELEETLSGLVARPMRPAGSDTVRPLSRTASAGPRIIYLCPADDVPTGGIKVIYRHAELLASMGTDAYVLHPLDVDFSCTWFSHRVPLLRSLTLDPSRDFVIIPELWAGSFGPQCMAQGVRFAIFVQNGYLTHPVLPEQPYALLHEVYRAADLVLSISEDSAGMVLLNYPGIDATRILTVQYSIHPRFLAPSDRVRPGPRGITFMPRKMGHHAVLVTTALRQQLPPHWRISAIAGVGEDVVAELLTASRIFLSFSEFEGLPLPPLEAAIAGNLVIGYTGQGARQYWEAPNFVEVHQGDIRNFVASVCQGVADIESGRLTPADLQPGVDRLVRGFSAESEVATMRALLGAVRLSFSGPSRTSALANVA